MEEWKCVRVVFPNTFKYGVPVMLAWKPLSWKKRSGPAVVRLVFPPHPPPLPLCHLSLSLHRCFPASASGRPGTWVWVQPCCWRVLRWESDPPRTESAWRHSLSPSPNKTQRRPGICVPRRGFEPRLGCCFQLRQKNKNKNRHYVLGDVIKHEKRHVNSCPDLLGSAGCGGVRKGHAPLHCSTWSSKVTELLLFTVRLLPCWWWGESSVEKLSNSITSVPAWAPRQTQSSCVSTSRHSWHRLLCPSKTHQYTDVKCVILTRFSTLSHNTHMSPEWNWSRCLLCCSRGPAVALHRPTWPSDVGTSPSLKKNEECFKVQHLAPQTGL